MDFKHKDNRQNGLIRQVQTLLWLVFVTVFCVFFMLVGVLLMWCFPYTWQQHQAKQLQPASQEAFWTAPDINNIRDVALKAQIEYGKELIVHTAKYVGVRNAAQNINTEMNCQNCHLEAGTKIFGNNYGSVASLYPKFRARSNSIEDIHKRVNDCFERSLNGQALDTNSREMQAIKAYIVFLGSNVKKGTAVKGAGLKNLAYLERAASPEKGKQVYALKCQSCHQSKGEGVLKADKTEYLYPPLWGADSYNDMSGLYRISNFAKYVKYNMPLGTTHETPLLSDEESWDVAAFVNSQPRPHKEMPKDWADITQKPVDYPFAPYADNFSEKQHKYGPFQPIIEAQKKQKSKK